MNRLYFGIDDIKCEKALDNTNEQDCMVDPCDLLYIGMWIKTGEGMIFKTWYVITFR
jgi:hypothetical protein